MCDLAVIADNPQTKHNFSKQGISAEIYPFRFDFYIVISSPHRVYNIHKCTFPLRLGKRKTVPGTYNAYHYLE